MKKVYIVSDGSGRTAEQTLKAALTQFPKPKIKIVRRPGIIDEEHIQEVIQEASYNDGFIIHTLVSDELREKLFRIARYNNVDTIDLMGPLLARLSDELATSPSEEPGLFKLINESYFRRVETMNFAFKHDDGQRAHELKKAEIVLLGVSRTFKTPLSIYLAFKLWFVANVPIIFKMEPMPQVYEIEPERVFCLVSDPRRLSVLRKARHDHLLQATGDYADYEFVKREMQYARNLYHRHPKWTIINVTMKSIEEIASEIIAMARKSQLKR